MKVCFLTGEFPPMQGGVADHTSHLARCLAELGVDVSVVTSRKVASDSLSSVTSLDIYPIVSGWGWGCWSQIGRWLGEHHPDVLRVHSCSAP